MTDVLRIPIDRQLSERTRWLITLRWIILTLAVGAVLLANRWLGNVLSGWALWATLIGVAICNGLFWLWARHLTRSDAEQQRYLWLMHTQITVDLLTITVLLHFSGGLENPFSLYYLLPLIVGSMLTTRGVSFAYATVASLFWVGLLLLEAHGIVPHYHLAGFRNPARYQQSSHLIAEGFVLVSALYITAYLTSSIVGRLRAGEHRLYEASEACRMYTAQLETSNERLKELDETRSLFIRLVTHELRAPVAAIQSYLRLILDGYVPEERMDEIISKAEQRANDQLALISDLLDLARLQEPHADEEIEPCDAAQLLQDTLDMMAARMADSQLVHQLDIGDDLPLAHANCEHVKQVWINLISNAIKYTPSGGSIQIGLHQDGELLRGSVSDTGIGIDPEDVDQVFEGFYRTEKAKQMSPHGTGLGLSIVKGIVERYGGEILVESEVSQGTTFTFWLPLVEGAPEVRRHSS